MPNTLEIQGLLKIQGQILLGTSEGVIPGTTLWTFPTPIPGTTVTGFSITTSPAGNITTYWGDGSSSTTSSGSIAPTKTY